MVRSLLSQKIVYVLICCCSGTRVSLEEQPTKPNIIFALADDLGWNGVGYYEGEAYTPTESQRNVTIIRRRPFGKALQRLAGVFAYKRNCVNWSQS